MVSLEFFLDIILPTALWPWGWLSLYQKWLLGIFPEGQRQLVHGADNLTTFMCWLSWNLGASASSNPQGLSRPVMGLLLPLKSSNGLTYAQFECIVRNWVKRGNICWWNIQYSCYGSFGRTLQNIHRIKGKMDSEYKIQVSLSVNLNVGCYKCREWRLCQCISLGC